MENNNQNYSAALKWLQDVANSGPNTGVREDGVLAAYASLLVAKIDRLESSEIKIYRLLIRFNEGNAPDAWVTERAYTAADAITQTLTKQRFAWPDVQVLEVVPFETV